MLRPFLIVGVGGSGGKTIRALKVALERKLREVENWDQGMPTAWQFLHVDTPTVQDGVSFAAPLLPNEEYIGIVPPQAQYQPLVSALTGRPFGAKLNQDEMERFGGWIPNPEEVRVPIEDGAGQFRAIGRTLTVARLDDIRRAVQTKFAGLEGARSKGQLAELSSRLGFPAMVDDPMVLVISSIAGGSGAGAYIDVVEAIKSCSTNPWAQRVVAWLYTPDVFEKISGRGGVAPNALAVVSETMNGLWSKSISPGTNAIYQSKGINPVNLQDANVGPKYTFLVGRKNNDTDFDSQEAVYMATSGSLAAFMTDAMAQDNFWAYYITNLDAQAALENNLPDRSRLKVENVQRPPFLSMGFAQVSMGRDRFREFATQRLTRDVVERILEGHKRELSPADRREHTEDELIQAAADQAWLDFLENSRLNERNPANDVVEALSSSDLANRAATYGQRALQSAQIGSKGASPDEWTTKLVGFFNNNREAFRAEDAVSRGVQAREWVADISKSFPALVADFSIRVGLPATLRLLSRLVEEIDFSVRELEQEQSRDLRYASEISSGISQALNQGMATLPPNHAYVQEAGRRVGKAFELVSCAETYALAAELMRDFSQNLLRPLAQTVNSALKSLDEGWRADLLTSGARNPVLDWADPKVDTVPRSFTPPPNEQVLLQTTDYISTFTALVDTSVPQENRGRATHNATYVARAIALGNAIAAPDGSPSALKFTLVETVQDWVPKNQTARPNSSAATSVAAKFALPADPNEYLDRTDKWLMQPGGQFSAFIQESLASYLADGAAADGELTQRRSAFLTAFGAALKSGKPLVDVDVSIAAAIHPGIDATDVSYTVSAIPVDPNSVLAQSVLNLFPGSQVQEAKKWFENAPQAREINFTTFLKNPMQPMVFKSVMAPIDAQWGRERQLSTSREGFYKWRRTRPLVEFIPAAPQQIESMIRGWLIADLFGQFRTSKDAERGAKIEIWSPNHGHVSFPEPLLHPGIPPLTDYLGVALESLSIALVLSSTNQGNPLQPLQAYHRLMDLGGKAAENPGMELSDWVSSGSLPPGAPALKVEAGSDSASRSQYLKRRLREKMDNSLELRTKVDEEGDPYKTTRAWELHSLRLMAASQLEKLLGNLSDEGEM